MNKDDAPISRGPEPPSTLGQLLAGARPRDPVGLPIARSRIAAALFGGASGGIGRFQLLDRLGAGGMGVIYKAYDPDLERAVAVKLVRLSGLNGNDALAEAKALARLAHPNVVAVFDHGLADEHLYIVMELVIGQTLGQWVRGRPRREIVRAYRQAGEALAAAHAVGLVHRDFKPGNAIMGGDGRLRVVDFGLACETADPVRGEPALQRAAGTPGYMAPEQKRGEHVTAKTDQYGFCTALEEALRGRRGDAPIPRWLQLVINRGKSAAPDDRFPSMNALLHALARDPAVVRRRWIVAAGLLNAGAVAFWSGRATLSGGEDVCERGEAQLASVWGPLGRDAALARVAALSPYGRSLVPRLRDELDAHAARWTVSYREACLANRRTTTPTQVDGRRMACLERGRAALRSAAEIVRTANASNAPDLILATNALPDPEACNDVTALMSNTDAPPSAIAARVAELRGRLEETRVQIAAGRATQARGPAAEIVAAARALSYKPLVGEALLIQGHALLLADDRLAAIEPLTEAYRSAFEAGQSSLAVEAWARRAWTRGTALGAADSLEGLDVIEAVAANPATSAFSRGLLHNNVGCVHLAFEERDLARIAFEQATRDLRGYTGADAGELLSLNLNLGLLIDDPARRDVVLAKAATDDARVLGDDHPETLDVQRMRGTTAPRFARAVEILVPACRGLDAYGGPRAARCWLDIAFIRGETGDMHGAVAAADKASTAAGPQLAQVPMAEPYRLFWQGNAAGAARGFAAALAGMSSDGKEPWWVSLDRADLELGLGRSLRSLGRAREASRALSASLDHLARAAIGAPSPVTSRRIGRARAELAKATVALRGSPRMISSLAAAAAASLREAGGTDEEIVELGRLAHLQ